MHLNEDEVRGAIAWHIKVKYGTQKKAADELGIAQSHISNAINGKPVPLPLLAFSAAHQRADRCYPPHWPGSHH